MLMQMEVFWVSKCIPLSKFWNRIVSICMHFNIALPTAVCAEHRLWPDSDERPGLPRWDVPSSQAPSSCHGPLRVEAYSRAHHPQGPGQGGLQRHINIAFHAAALNRNFLFFLIFCCMFLFGWVSAVNLPKSPTADIWLGPETFQYLCIIPTDLKSFNWLHFVVIFSSCWGLQAKTVQDSRL